MTDTTSKIYKAIKLFVLQQAKCYYCQCELWNGGNDVMFCNIDHKIPTSRGGKNEFSNYCLTCVPCNTEKGSLTDTEYFSFKDLVKRGKMTKKDILAYINYIEMKKKFEGADAMLAVPSPVDLTSIPPPEDKRKLEIKSQN